jgi:selenocysteine lyase/cysteine desulfurase
MLDVQKIREDFPTVKKCIYLSNCSESPMPLQVAEKIITDGLLPKIDKTIEKNFFDPVEKARKEAAKLINAHEDEIGLARGTTETINIVATMIPWKKTDNIILNDLEFPSNVFPFQRLQKLYGFSIQTVKNRDGQILVEDIVRLMDSNTRLVAVSLVCMANGFRLDIEKLGEETRRRGILLEVDGVQALGSRKIDVRAMNIDFLCIGGHKYALGPSGTAFLYVRRELIKEFEPLYMGPWQQDSVFDFTYHDYVLADTARRFEFGGHPNVLGVPGLAAALEYLNFYGVDEIDAYCGELVVFLADCLRKHGLDVPAWAVNPKNLGSYIGIKTKKPVKEVVDILKQKYKVYCSTTSTLLGDRLRIAPSFYNTQEEIETAVKAIAEIEQG